MNEKVLHWMVRLAVAVSALAVIADFFSLKAINVIQKVFGTQVDSSLPHWLEVLPQELAVVAVLLAVLYFAEATKKTQEDVGDNKQTLQELKPEIHETRILVGQKSVVQAIDPTNEDQFEAIFGDALTISAYNPPLTLLTNGRNSHFRDVIFDFLSKGDHSYRMIVGPEGDQRLDDLYTLWANQHGVRSPASQAFARLRITLYSHPEKLHTEIEAWPAFKGNDLRGLSFFLIVTPTCRRVLLYILGKPFVEDFKVPDLGLLISEPLDEAESRIFERLRPVFDRRWRSLEANGSYPNVVADLPLPAFIAQRRTRVSSGIPKTEGKSA